MIKLDRIYTRGGDGGETSLGDGQRVSKSDPRIKTLAAVEEANAVIGVARLHTSGAIDEILGRIQNDLFDLGADIAVPDKEGALRITAAQIEHLESDIDDLNAGLEPLTSFILPGGGIAAVYLHLARTVVRRAETEAVGVGNADLPRCYLNRLSDLMFVMARSVSNSEALWEPGSV